ncbi:MAG: hypothetical protein H0Z19_11860 [Archaeoglobus sp.]|uniref:hypothetical protein n=1 Tax=Archaeoglobus sp. TaxID=1872626 RepID=UPI001D60D464|nr:hypothetical protein [Archaeoglobus sp.]MBO8181144.1 hypothetical protein [Archaeoglobus sp.]
MSREIGLITQDVIDEWRQLKKHLSNALYHFHIADSVRACEEVKQAYELIEQIEQELRAAPRARIELEEE